MKEALEKIKAGERNYTDVWIQILILQIYIYIGVLINFCLFAELMLLGFISLLLTFGTQYIAKICIPTSAGDIMLPCKKVEESKKSDDSNDRRKLLYFEESMEWRRVLATASSGGDYCSQKVMNINYLFSYSLFFSM